MKRLVLGMIVAALAMGGCAEEPGDDKPLGTSPSAASGPNSLEGANAKAGRGGAKVVTELPKDGKIPAEGLVITPPNPDDPMYKPAPGMAGGG